MRRRARKVVVLRLSHVHFIVGAVRRRVHGCVARVESARHGWVRPALGPLGLAKLFLGEYGQGGLGALFASHLRSPATGEHVDAVLDGEWVGVGEK